MPCRELAGKPLRRRAARRSAKLLVAVAALGLAGCGSHLGNFDTPDSSGANDTPGGKLIATLLGMKRNEVKSEGAAAPSVQNRHIFCPEVIVLEGTAASRAYAGEPSSANLRYQSALNDTARECSLEGKELAIKIGVAGKVLLGPAGNAGSFSVPVRMAILRKQDNQPLVSKLYHATVTVGSGQTQADFTIVSEPLHVPFIQDHAEDDYTIRVGIDEGPGADEKGRKGAKR
jgi:hypothetical protein